MCGKAGWWMGGRGESDGESIGRTDGCGDGWEVASRVSGLLRERREGLRGEGCLSATRRGDFGGAVSTRGRLGERRGESWCSVGDKGEAGAESTGDASAGHTARAVLVASQGLEGGWRGMPSTRMSSAGAGVSCAMGCWHSSSASALRFLQLETGGSGWPRSPMGRREKREADI